MTVSYNPRTADKWFLYQPGRWASRVGRSRPTTSSTSSGCRLTAIVGLSVVQNCRASLGAAIARDEFEGSFYLRGAVLSGYLKHPGKLNPDAVRNLKESFRALYGGSPKRTARPCSRRAWSS
jgi:hypothetical protein